MQIKSTAVEAVISKSDLFEFRARDAANGEKGEK